MGGVEGRKSNGGDPALRPCLNLEEMETNPPVPGLAEYVTFLGRCRREHPVIGEGTYRELMLTTRQYAFARIGQNETAVVMVNNDENPATHSVPLPCAANRITELATGETYYAENGRLTAEVGPGEGRIFILEP